MRRLVKWFLNLIRILTTKKYFPQSSPRHVKKARKKRWQKFYFLICHPVVCRCMPLALLHSSSTWCIDASHHGHGVTNSLVHWDLDAVSNYILGLVYNTTWATPSLSHSETTGDCALERWQLLYLFQLFRSYPWPGLFTQCFCLYKVLLRLNFKAIASNNWVWTNCSCLR